MNTPYVGPEMLTGQSPCPEFRFRELYSCVTELLVWSSSLLSCVGIIYVEITDKLYGESVRGGDVVVDLGCL